MQPIFDTNRLLVRPWDATNPKLPEFVIDLLSPGVTAELPEAWHGEYSSDRASAWIAERENESTVLLAEDRTGTPVGLLILYVEERTVRIGYLLSEDHWGMGLATELISGFVDWCRDTGTFDEILAGVGVANRASIRVLEKCGFVRVGDDDNTNTEFVLFIRK